MSNTVVVGGAFTPGRKKEKGGGSLQRVANMAGWYDLGDRKNTRVFSMLEALKDPSAVADASQDGSLLIHSAGNLILPALVELASGEEELSLNVLFSANGPKKQTGPAWMKQGRLYAGGVGRLAYHAIAGLGRNGQAHAEVA